MATASKQPYPLHGYQPVMIDEHVLSREDRLEAFQELLRCNLWGQAKESSADYLTPDELASVQPDCPGQFVDGNDAVTQYRKRSELQILSHYRRYARQIYGDGRGIWCGDGVSPWMESPTSD